MDISSRRLPLAIIAILLAILIVQYVASPAANQSRLIDPMTCEIYLQVEPGGAREYSGEFDQKCVDLRELAP